MWKVNTSTILDCLDAGYTPVIATVGCDEEGPGLQHQRGYRRGPYRR